MSLLQDRIASMVHAFGDHERKDAVRALARDVGAMEAHVDGLRARVAELEARCKRLEEALSLFIVDCDNLHHSKKHQHGFHDPCPVVDLILDAKEAKP